MRVVIVIEGDSEQATVMYEIPKHVSGNSFTASSVCPRLSTQHPLKLADIMMDAAEEYLKKLAASKKVDR